jgi:hypothetical protein
MSWKTKNKMVEHHLEGCITGPRNTRQEETSWGEKLKRLFREARAQKGQQRRTFIDGFEKE